MQTSAARAGAELQTTHAFQRSQRLVIPEKARLVIPAKAGAVIPAKAGSQCEHRQRSRGVQGALDSRVRGNDEDADVCGAGWR